MNLATPLARVTCLAGMLAVAALVLLAPPAAAQVDSWDHYKVYRVMPTPTGPGTVLLRDQFLSSGHSVFTLDWFANPAQKQTSDGTVSPIHDPELHYSWWRIDGPPLGRSVIASNQFGDQSLFLTQPRYLWNPARKNSTLPLPVENHYKCYDCQGDPVDRDVTLTDQFGQWQTRAVLPRFFCTPADKTTSDGVTHPIVEASRHYVCYELQPPDPRTFTAVIRDQFRPEGFQVNMTDAQYLCVPTEKVDPTSVTPGTWGRVKIMYR
jgi:hypothetical protein